jgi:hypothetical protein
VLHDPATGSPVVCPIRRSTSGPAARTTRAAG